MKAAGVMAGVGVLLGGPIGALVGWSAGKVLLGAGIGALAGLGTATAIGVLGEFGEPTAPAKTGA